MFEEVAKKEFANGVVYALRTYDGYLIEVTDTFLPSYTKYAIGEHQNSLHSDDLGSRSERWMIGVSTMSGCPVRCKFCATGSMKKCRVLTTEEIVGQVDFITSKHTEKFVEAFEHKVNYTRMGEPFLNVKNVKRAVEIIECSYPNTHHYISTIGVQGADYSWIKDNITLQVSVHSLDDNRRNWLIPYKKKVTIKELGEIETKSTQKTTVNMTLVDENDFNISDLCTVFNKDKFFIKLSPINTNCVSDSNALGNGIIKSVNII